MAMLVMLVENAARLEQETQSEQAPQRAKFSFLLLIVSPGLLDLERAPPLFSTPFFCPSSTAAARDKPSFLTPTPG